MNMPDTNENSQLPEPLGSVVARIAATQPDAQETRSVVEALRQNPPNESHTAAAPAKERTRLFSRRALLTSGTVAAALLVVTMVLLRPANALGKIADALASQKCIKMTSTQDGAAHESWIMPATRQLATRTDDWIEFFEADAETVETYNRKTDELVRSVKFRQDFEFISELVSAIIASGKSDSPETIRGMQVMSSKVKTIDGKKVLTLELDPTSIRGLAEDATATATITVDPATDLPSRCVATLHNNGEVQTISETWTYPKNGPANIFALGVDPATKLIDRVPSTAVKPLVAGIYSGRLKFDDYVAVTIETRREEPRFGHGDGGFTLAAKQGDKVLYASFRDSWKGFKGKTASEVAEMILADPSRFKWNAQVILDGTTVHYCFSTVRTQDINCPPEEFIMPGWDVIPHYVGRPPLESDVQIFHQQLQRMPRVGQKVACFCRP